MLPKACFAPIVRLSETLGAIPTQSTDRVGQVGMYRQLDLHTRFDDRVMPAIAVDHVAMIRRVRLDTSILADNFCYAPRMRESLVPPRRG